MTSDEKESPVRSVARAVDILLVVGDGAGQLGQIAERTGLSKATAHRLLAALSHRAMVLQDSLTGEYVLGPGSIAFADAVVIGAARLGALARTELTGLTEITNETSTLHIRVGTRRFCIAEIPSPSPVRFTSGLGVSEPVHSGSAGKVLLAFLPEAAREKLLNQSELKPVTENTITDRGMLEAELARVAEAGWAQSRGERVPGGTGVSAPVFGEAGQIVATVSVLGPSERLSDAKIAELVPTLLRAAKAITDRVLLEPVASTVP